LRSALREAAPYKPFPSSATVVPPCLSDSVIVAYPAGARPLVLVPYAGARDRIVLLGSTSKRPRREDQNISFRRPAPMRAPAIVFFSMTFPLGIHVNSFFQGDPPRQGIFSRYVSRSESNLSSPTARRPAGFSSDALSIATSTRTQAPASNDFEQRPPMACPPWSEICVRTDRTRQYGKPVRVVCKVQQPPRLIAP